MFSILICSYNKSRSLQAILINLNNLVSWKDLYSFEVVVVVDGSTDDTMTIIREMELQFTLRIFYIENCGLSKARNYGIEQCLGGYVICCDDDVLLHPDYLEHLAVSVKRHPLCVHLGNLINIDKRYTAEIVDHLINKQGIDYSSLNLLQADHIFFEALKKLYFFQEQEKISQQEPEQEQKFRREDEFEQEQNLGLEQQYKDFCDEGLDEREDREKGRQYGRVEDGNPGEKTDQDFSPAIWWAVTTGGNLCIPRSYFTYYGKFDGDIIGWGPEDADLCYRFFKNGIKASYNENCLLYHLDHERDSSLLLQQMTKNAVYFIKKYKKPEELYAYLNFTNGKLSLLEFNNKCCDLFNLKRINIPPFSLSMKDYSGKNEFLTPGS